MKTANKLLEYRTKDKFDFIGLTEEIKGFVEQSLIKNGLVNIQILHTSSALMMNENEPLLLQDIKKNLENCAPEKQSYQHDDFSIRTVNMCPGECANGHSHCKAIHLLANITINLINNKLQLGQYQSIMLVELDRSRPRKVQIQIIGE